MSDNNNDNDKIYLYRVNRVSTHSDNISGLP